jgi:hypothetical protein
MLDLVSDGSSWEEIVDLAVRIEQAGATIINTGVLLADGASPLFTLHYTNTQPSPLVRLHPYHVQAFACLLSCLTGYVTFCVFGAVQA